MLIVKSCDEESTSENSFKESRCRWENGNETAGKNTSELAEEIMPLGVRLEPCACPVRTRMRGSLFEINLGGIAEECLSSHGWDEGLFIFFMLLQIILKKQEIIINGGKQHAQNT